MARTPGMTVLQRLRRGERGQVMVMVVGLLAVLGGMAALAIDLGSYAADRRDLQNAADAIALAASQELPNVVTGQLAADDWATKNGIDPADVTLQFVSQSLPVEPNPKVRVTIDTEHEFFFAALVGISSTDVSAKAAAIKTSASGGDGIVPLSVQEDALINPPPGVGLGDAIVLKYDANNITQGNTNPIRIDGTGSGNCTQGSAYCYGVRNGSDNYICALGVDMSYCNPTGSAEHDPYVDTQTGNMVGATRTAIEWRLANTDVHCDTFEEVFEDDPTSLVAGDYRIVQACNPFAPGGYASERVLIVPVIDSLCNGSCEVTIVDFVLVFLEGFGNGGCSGHDCEVVGRFVRVNQNVGMLAGTFDPLAFNNFVRLTE